MPLPLLVEPAALLPRLGREPIVCIDCRPADDYAGGHLPGAVSIPELYDHLVTDTRPADLEKFQAFLGNLLSRAGVTPEQEVVCYDDRTGMRAARGLWVLRYVGHDRSRLLHGGVEGWLAAGGALETGKVKPRRSKFQVRPKADVLATAEQARAAARKRGIAILDVRREDEFYGSGGMDCCPRRGHLPDATWFPWERFLDGDRFRERAEILSTLQGMGVTPDREIICYCHRGARSANTWLALSLLGYPRVRNYIGSWHEWSNRPELPVEGGR